MLGSTSSLLIFQGITNVSINKASNNCYCGLSCLVSFLDRLIVPEINLSHNVNNIDVIPANKTEESIILLFGTFLNVFIPIMEVPVARIGNNTNNFNGGHNHNKWNTGNFSDDDFGFGRKETDLYDDLVDIENSKKHR